MYSPPVSTSGTHEPIKSSVPSDVLPAVPPPAAVLVVHEGLRRWSRWSTCCWTRTPRATPGRRPSSAAPPSVLAPRRRNVLRSIGDPTSPPGAEWGAAPLHRKLGAEYYGFVAGQRNTPFRTVRRSRFVPSCRGGQRLHSCARRRRRRSPSRGPGHVGDPRGKLVATGVTDASGRVAALAEGLAPGVYRLRWDLADGPAFARGRRRRRAEREPALSRPPARRAGLRGQLPRRLTRTLSPPRGCRHRAGGARRRPAAAVGGRRGPSSSASSVGLLVVGRVDRRRGAADRRASRHRAGRAALSIHVSAPSRRRWRREAPFRSCEQGGDADVDDAVLAELEALNDRYEARFGFPFVAWVAGRSRAQMIAVIEDRLTHAVTPS